MAKQRYKKIQAGRLVREAVWTPVFACADRAERAARQNVTTAARRRINLRKASEHLTYLLAANFAGADVMYTLTFDDEHLPPDRIEARKVIKRFIAQLRTTLRERGRELKYVYAMEGKHGNKRLHFHIVLNIPEPEKQLVLSFWPYGYVHSRRVDVTSYKELGRYLTKESREEGARVGAHSWSASRNLCKPEVSPTEWVPDTMRIEPPANSHIIEREEKVNEYGHFFFVEYFLPEIPSRKVCPPNLNSSVISSWSSV